ncbi:hypothetical protein CPT_Stahl41 [Bacillus phage Stahl]|uniref:Uncharacterized protein n=1 Tax=Bacillus phage Stahl TaxID=1610832 RepID=A0A0E3GMN5_9CAUD|nr:hypothetical protein CPT_Stahl41 [Bacillus phage Stahl]AKA61469.1 hypothetical protein CPT_Stahl41 [Bacillus phage Stahl]
MTSYLYDDGNGLRTSARVEPTTGKPITDVSNMVKTKSGLWIPQTGTEDGAANVQVAGSDIMMPTHLQRQLTPQDKVATAFSVGAGSTQTVFVADFDGFANFGVMSVPTASHDYNLSVFCSPDGNTLVERNMKSGTGWGKSLTGASVGAFVMIQITNNSGSAANYDIWLRKFN